MCIYLTSWLVFNKLTLNINKTVYISFGRYCDNVTNELNIKLDNQSIKRVEAHKYLGLIFDYNMKWDAHMKYIVKNQIHDFYFCENRKYYRNKNANDNVLCTIPQHIKLWHNRLGWCI